MEFFIVVILIFILIINIWQFQQSKDIFSNPKYLSELNQQTQNLQAVLHKNSQETLQVILNERVETNRQNLTEILKIQEKLAEGQIQSQTQIKNQLESLTDKILKISQQELTKIQTITNQQLELLQKTNQQKLEDINLNVQKRLDENFANNLKSIKEVTDNLGQIRQTARQMIKSSESIDKLNQVFARTSSKAYGGFAEDYLESLLSENLQASSWKKQVKVPNGAEILDFMLVIEDKKIGIDAKFPLSRYQDYIDSELTNREQKLKDYLKAVENMAASISSKYLQSHFVDTLLMYLPSDSMYTEVVNNPKLMEKLQKLKVNPTSPATIFPLLKLINSYEYKQHINQNAELIIQKLGVISKSFRVFQDEFRKLGDKLRQAQDNYDKADRNLLGVQKNILTLESKQEDKGDKII